MQGVKAITNKISFFIPFVLFLFSFGLYLHNLSPSVFGGDVGDFVSAIVTRGVPHPSGYPLFTILGIIVNFLPVGLSSAWRVGLLSAFVAACSIVLLYQLVNLLIKNKIISVITALYLAFFSIFWLYAEIAEIFSLTVFFILLLFFLSISYYKTKKALYLYLLSFFVGLSLTHHEIIMAFFPSLVIVVLSANWRIIKNPALLLTCVGLFLLGLIPYVYIPIAASHHPLVSWDNAQTLQNFVRLVTRADYGWQPTGDITFSFRILAVKAYLEKIFIELTPAGVFMMALGIVQAIRTKQYAIFFALFLGFFLTGPFYVWYGFIPLLSGFAMGVIERFYLISSIFLFIFFGFGLDLLANTIVYIIPSSNKKRKLLYKYAIILVFSILPLTLLRINFPKTDLHAIWIGDNLGMDILTPLPKQSVLAIQGDTVFFDTEYMHVARFIRPDITLTNVISLNDHKDILRDIAMTTKGQAVPADIKFLISLVSFSKKAPVFATTQFQFKDNTYPRIEWIPYGIVFKIANEQEKKLSEQEFVRIQEDLFKRMHIPGSFSQTKLAFHNLTISDIPAVYAQGYVNIGDYLLSHFSDALLSKEYYLRALDSYPFLSSAYTGLGYVYLAENNCKNAENQFSSAKEIDPTKKAPYMALYLSYINCSKDPIKAKKIADDFSKIFAFSILTAIKQGVR